ncbi:amphi-Trp domain-containing protein [Streptomyces sp. NPDC014882]|uniref:amphi-Trp domain-containing protein n=1 Tax=Streptomyces sp. NPDC014882 TaxID=3364927 RepID=UPI0036F866F2
MKDLTFERKRSLSRQEAAEQLAALAAALREDGDAAWELGPGTLSLRVPDRLRSEIEIEIGDGEVELEIELKWSTAVPRTQPSRTAEDTNEAATGKKAPTEPGQKRTGTTARDSKRSATKAS